MGSPISLIVANLYMENFETRAISTSPHPPLIWKRFVDDTCVIIKEAHKQEFLEHINSIDPHIQFTSEDSKTDGSMPFVDMLITPTEDGRLNTTVYRKPTHTDMYLRWDSHHPISSKYSVVDTLHHRAKTDCFWRNLPKRRKTPATITTKQTTKSAIWLYLITKDLVKVWKELATNMGYKYTSEEVSPSKNLLMAPKGQDPMLKKSRVIYRYKCDRVECDEEYIGESLRTFWERFKEHQKAPSPSMTTTTSLVIWLA